MAKQVTFAIAYGGNDTLRVVETQGGAFKTPEAAAERIIEMCDFRVGCLRASKAAAKKILRATLKGQQHDK